MDNTADILSGILGNPEAMNTISEILGSLGGAGESDESEKTSDDNPTQSEMDDTFNPETMMKIMGAISKMSADDNSIRLLMAVKPYLTGKRLEKFDNAVKILKLSKLSGVVKEMF